MVNAMDIQNQAAVVLSHVDSDLISAYREFQSLCELVNGLPESPNKAKALEKVNKYSKSLLELKQAKNVPGQEFREMMKNGLKNGCADILIAIMSK